MQNPKPATFNTVLNDTEGTTWELPTGAIARLGKGFQNYNGDCEMALSHLMAHFWQVMVLMAHAYYGMWILSFNSSRHTHKI